MSALRHRVGALAVAALLAASHAGAQTASTAVLEPAAGQSANGAIDVVENAYHHLDVTLRLFRMPRDRTFALHLADPERCASAAETPPIVPDVPRLRADRDGMAVVMFTLDKPTLAPGTDSIAGRPVGIYASAQDGGALLACGTLGPKRQTFTTGPPPPAPAASLDDARACMDSEDRIVALVRRGDADHLAVDASRTADDRLAASQVRAAHEAQLQAYLKTHDQVCGKLRIDPRERAAVLAERAAAAASAAR